MKKSIVSFLGLLLMGLFFTLSFSNCSKTDDPKPDTVIIKKTDTLVLNTKTDTSVNLTKGLLVYYKFDNNVADSSGNSRNGTIAGTLQYSTDKANTSNGAALFNGTNAYITLNDQGALSPGSFTLSAQFYATGTTHQTLFGKLNYATSNTISWGVALYGGTPTYTNSATFGVRGTATACGAFDPMGISDLVYSMEDIQANKWYHIACVFDKGVEKIYLNGTLRNAITRDFVTPKQCTDAQIVIGAWWQGAPLFFAGKMDEFRMYSRALNDTEIGVLGKGF